MSCVFKKIRWCTKSQKRRLSVNFNHALICFGFLVNWRLDKEIILRRRQGISTLHCVISQKSTDLTWQFGNADVQSHPLWRCPVWCFICKFKMTSHTEVPNLRKKLVLLSSKYSNLKYYTNLARHDTASTHNITTNCKRQNTKAVLKVPTLKSNCNKVSIRGQCN